MMKSKVVKWLMALPLLAIACTGCENKERTVSGIGVISDFPETIMLNSGDTLANSIDDIGISSIRVVDSLILIRKPDTWSVYSVYGKYYGDALKRGDGPCEFTMIPFISTTTLARGDSLIFYLVDTLKGKEIAFNLTAYLDKSEGDNPYLKEKQVGLTSGKAWGPVRVSEDTYIFATPVEAETKQLRMMANGDSIVDLNLPSAVNHMSISEGEDINILSRINAYSPEKGKIVEAGIRQNVISVYSPDGKFDRSVSIGEPILAEQIMSIDPENRKYTFRDLSLWENGFGVLSYPIMENEEDVNGIGYSEIYVFNWKCEPIMKIVLDIPVKTFDIDFNSNRLFAVDADNDEMRVYKIDTAGIR